MYQQQPAYGQQPQQGFNPLQGMPTMSAPVGASIPLIPDGAFYGTIIDITHLGTIDSEYKGVTSKKDKIRIKFETSFTHQFDDGVKPLCVDVEMTRAFGDNAKLTEIWLAAFPGFPKAQLASGPNIFDLLGRTITIGVATKVSSAGRSRNEIVSFSPLIAGSQVPPLFNEITAFGWIPDANAMAWFRPHLAKLSNWIKYTLSTSVEFAQFAQQGLLPADMVDEIRKGAAEYIHRKNGAPAQAANTIYQHPSISPTVPPVAPYQQPQPQYQQPQGYPQQQAPQGYPQQQAPQGGWQQPQQSQPQAPQHQQPQGNWQQPQGQYPQQPAQQPQQPAYGQQPVQSQPPMVADVTVVDKIDELPY